MYFKNIWESETGGPSRQIIFDKHLSVFVNGGK